MGCLLAPFRALGCLVVLVGLAGAWLYRDRLLEMGGRLLRGEPAPVEAIGRPGPRALAAARARADSLTRGRADTVVLSANETASLIVAGLAPAVRSQLDSLQVTLRQERIELTMSLATGRLPRNVVGPLGIGLRNREPVRASGPFAVMKPGVGEWTIDRIDVRGMPLPADLVPTLLERLFAEPGRRSVELALPRGVREVRVSPLGLVLYGAARS
ncbi:MAG TPA: hypothetical protein VFM14_14110 [Gemmatimonadales bacterium]|nr:hypothetical protein [Gemmatimonadales bacterium]